MNLFTTKVKPKIEWGILSEKDCLAKTKAYYSNDEIHYEKGCDIYTHLWITCRIIQTLQKLWQELPLGKLIFAESQWLAALHDIGKVTPAFLCKIYKKLDVKIPWATEINENIGGHSRSSEIILNSLYGETFARLAANHHGGASWTLDIGDNLQNEILGGNEWQELRSKIITRLKENLNLPDCDLKHIPPQKCDLILGSTILADWLSSSMDLPYGSELPSDQQIYATIKNTGFIPLSWNKNLSFEHLFGFPPNLLQIECLRTAAPGNIFIIESGMGSGKTEAALAIAYQLLQKKEANGLYFAMPTKLTSEKIFDRLNNFLQKGIADGISIKPLLIHGDSWLEWNLAETDHNGDIINAGQWFQTKKRALLAPFAAGTVDQALMAVVNVRHRALRAFALTGKIIVFDEVHSYDSYTGTLIMNLIQKIREWGGTVIILSATLTAKAKADLLGMPVNKYNPSAAYPLLTIKIQSTNVIQEIPIPENQKKDVVIKNVYDEQEALREAYNRASKGEQVLWIENTVEQAQNIFSILQTATSCYEIGLIHSRFPMIVRQTKEDYWVRILGKRGGKERISHGRIIVATQILEQSVDVDADFLVTRLAPVDMMLQRIGRLWRHRVLNELRPKSARMEAWVLIPQTYHTPEDLMTDTSAYLPYDPYWMFRTYQAWKNVHSVSIPGDIRHLLESIYRDQNELGPALQMKNMMAAQKEKLEKQAYISQGSADKPLSDEIVSTRCSEIETVQVLLLYKGNHGFPLDEKLAVLFSEYPIVLPALSATKAERVAVVRQLQQCMIRVPAYMAPEYEDWIEHSLKELFWTGDDESRPIRAAYVDDSGMLLTISGLPVTGKYELSYHKNLGFRSIKK